MPKLDLPGSYRPILGKNQGRFGEFFRYLWLSSFQEDKFRIAESTHIKIISTTILSWQDALSIVSYYRQRIFIKSQLFLAYIIYTKQNRM
jgi:hypothetical protein